MQAAIPRNFTSGKALRRAAFVAVMQTTELRDRNDGTLGRVGDP